MTVSSLVGCATFPARQEWESESMGGSPELSIEIGPPTAGIAEFRIFGGAIEGATLSGTATLSQDGWELTFSSMHWFNNWSNGWTEAEFSMSGQLQMLPKGQAWYASVVTPPRIGEPVRTSIRYFYDYLVGERALEEFSNRWKRILSLVTLLKERFQDRKLDYTVPKWSFGRSSQLPSFVEASRQFLFPELYGYAVPPKGDGPSVRSESVSWSVDYTTTNFPENLRPIRNSGTMLRDFEECLPLWRLAYVFEELWMLRLKETTFNLIEKR
jgi:hypothetical protein